MVARSRLPVLREPRGAPTAASPRDRPAGARPGPATASVAPLSPLQVPIEDVRRAVIAIHGTRIRAQGADVDDVVGDVLLRLVATQRNPASRWDPARGMSATSYVYRVVATAGANSLRACGRRRAWDVPTEGVADYAGPDLGESVRLGAAMDRMLAVLDLPEEREMALRLVEGCTLKEICEAMRLAPKVAAELQTRVRALLMVVREEE